MTGQKKINNQTSCPKIDIFVNGEYKCSTDQSKTCGAAIIGYIKANPKQDKTEKVTAFFDRS